MNGEFYDFVSSKHAFISKEHADHLKAICLILALFLIPMLCFADFDSSLRGIKATLMGVVLPTLSVIGIVFAAFSFSSGSPNAKQHIVYAIIGVCLGFGAQIIVDLIKVTVR